MSDHLMRMGKSTLADDMRAAGFDVKVEKGDGPIQGLGLTGVIMDEAIEPKVTVARNIAAKTAAAALDKYPRIADRASYHCVIDPGGESRISGLGFLSPDQQEAVIAEGKRILGEACRGMAEYDRAMADAARTGVGMWRFDPYDFLEVAPAEQEPAPVEKPAKPVLLIPEGCMLTVPFGFDLTPFEVRAIGRLVVVGGAEPAPAPAAKPTPAGLTFEQPIQSRLGRLAR